MNTDDLYLGKGLTGKIFSWEKKKRFELALDMLLDKFSSTELTNDDSKILDVGSRDGEFISILKENGFKDVVGIDKHPKSNSVIRGNVENLKFQDDSFDVVVALDILEHVPNPSKALMEMRRVCKNVIIICIPNEPWFSFWRLSRCKEHLWTPTPEALNYYLGNPLTERYFALKREYIAKWLLYK